MGSSPLAMRLPILLLTMWSFLFFGLAAAQSTTTSATPTTTTAATPTLTFAAIPTMTACKAANIMWQLSGSGIDPKLYNITLTIVNSGVDQTIPSSAAAASAVSSTAAASSTSATLDRRATTPFSLTLPPHSAAVAYAFNPVTLPQGRYVIKGVIDNAQKTTALSGSFTVLETGGDTSCLAALSSLTSASATKTGTGTGTATSTGGASPANGGMSAASGGIPTGAIVGIAVGAVAALAIIALAIFCCRRRRRTRNRTSSFDDKQHPHQPIGSDDMNHHYGPQPTSREIALGAIGSGGKRGSGGSSTLEKVPEARNEKPYGAESVEELAAAQPVFPGGGGGGAGRQDPFATPLSQHTDAFFPSTPRSAGWAEDQNYTHHQPQQHQPYPSSSSSRGGPAIVQGRPESQIDFSRHRPSESLTDAYGGIIVGDTRRHSAGPGSPEGGGGGAKGVVRKASAKRKPVPSLGAELRSQMDAAKERERPSARVGDGNSAGSNASAGEAAGGKQTFALVPDMPLPQRD